MNQLDQIRAKGHEAAEARIKGDVARAERAKRRADRMIRLADDRREAKRAYAEAYSDRMDRHDPIRPTGD